MTPSMEILIARSWGHSGTTKRTKLRRVVVRLDEETIARLDALLPRFDDASRASLVRGFILYALAVVEGRHE